MHTAHHRKKGPSARREVPYADLLVSRIDLTIRSGMTVSVHSLEFDDLTVREMKRDGFCGPVYLKDSDGVIHECELSANNPADVDGTPVGGLVFRVDCPRESGLDAEVTKYFAKKVCPRYNHNRLRASATHE